MLNVAALMEGLIKYYQTLFVTVRIWLLSRKLQPCPYIALAWKNLLV